MVRMVVFDLDNTLYDYSSCNQAAEAQLLAQLSNRLKISEDDATQLLQKAKNNVKDRLGNVASSHNRMLYMQDICEQVGINPLLYAMDFYNLYWDTLLEQMQLYPYVKPLLHQLHKKNILIGILTDLTAHIQYRKLEKLQLLSDIDCLVTSEEAGEEKPSEKIFSRLLSKAAVQPEEIVMVGDSMAKDVDGALAAGMGAILFRPDCDIGKEVLGLL